MADFCKDCYPSIWGEQGNDFVGLITKEQFDAGFVGFGLCEGCAQYILVDPEGNITDRVPFEREDNSNATQEPPTKPNRLCPELLCE